MNDDFAPLELAVKLKEKGFREKCIATYDIEDKEFDFNNYILRVAYQMNVTAKDCLRVFNDSNCGLIDAPTISQVLKWLREEKKIHIIIDITNYGFISSTMSFKWDKSYCNNEIEHYDHKGYSTYEQAAIAGISYVLDNL